MGCANGILLKLVTLEPTKIFIDGVINLELYFEIRVRSIVLCLCSLITLLQCPRVQSNIDGIIMVVLFLSQSFTGFSWMGEKGDTVPWFRRKRGCKTS